jgi:CRP-like cAMP-binding protein
VWPPSSPAERSIKRPRARMGVCDAPEREKGGQNSTFPLTQEFLAEMLGVRRATVNLAIGILKSAGFIEYVRGQITIVDRVGLESASCACYDLIRKEYQTLNVD